MQDPFGERIYGIPWLALAAAGVAIAVFYAFVSPAAVPEGIGWVILRWGHTAAWLFLAASAAVRARVAGLPMETAAPLAATGGLIYVALMVTTLSASGV